MKKNEKLMSKFISTITEKHKREIDEINKIFEKDGLKAEKYLNMEDAFFWSEDGRICVTCENGHGLIDYYGEFRGGYSYINETLEALAEKKGMFWEWQNPGCIILTE